MFAACFHQIEYLHPTSVQPSTCTEEMLTDAAKQTRQHICSRRFPEGLNLYCKQQSCYDVLELEEDATPVEVKKAYRRLSLKYHPDKSDADDAQAVFMSIATAYEVLGNEKMVSIHRTLPAPLRCPWIGIMLCTPQVFQDWLFFLRDLPCTGLLHVANRVAADATTVTHNHKTRTRAQTPAEGLR